MAIGDVIANRKPGATFSEHCRVWFKTPIAKVTLGVFFLVLYLHLVAQWPVYPIIIGGLGLVHFIRRSYVMFRWDKWMEGAVFAGAVTAIAAAPALLADGKITGVEAMMLLGTFLGGIALYIKQHPPQEWDGTERREGK